MDKSIEVGKLDPGASCIKDLLNGGYEKDIITTVYGPGGSGKSNLCMLALISTARSGKKVVYVDTEASFSLERLKQLADDHEKILKNIVFLRLTSFSEQKAAFEKLKKIVDDGVGLIIVDSIAMLYRLEMGRSQEVYEVNRALGLHLSFLSEITRTRHIPVLLTNQVYSPFDESRVRMVGGDILKYSSKCLIELQKFKAGRRKAILRKHRSLPEDKEVVFEIREKGIFHTDNQ